MSIASEISRINTNIANAYTACNGKGATMPASGSQNSANLATTISSITTGGGIGIPREVSTGGVYQMPSTSGFTFELPSNATDLGACVLGNAFRGCTAITTANFSSLTKISGENALNYAFQNCTGLTNVNLSNVEEISGQWSLECTFDGCTGLTSVDLSSLVNLKNNCCTSVFRGCTNLTNINFNSLYSIGGNTRNSLDYGQLKNSFTGCASLTSLSFPNLVSIYNWGSLNTSATFYGNSYIQKLYFPKLNIISGDSTGQKYIFYNCSALTELHFGAANQTAIEATAGYSTLWGRGAGNATVYFDL